MAPEWNKGWLNRNIFAISAATFLMSFGEELWKRFIPKFLEALGAPITAVGFYGSIKDFVDGLYQYPGGWISDRLGRRVALLIFVSLAICGYLLYVLAPTWHYVIIGVFFVMAWASMANPTLFAVIGDALPRGNRAAGFTVQSLLRRVPIMIAANLGAALIAAYGLIQGVRMSLGLTIGAALVTGAVVSTIRLPSVHKSESDGIPARQMLGPVLRRLLSSDILIRFCEGLSDVLTVIYATSVIGVSVAQYGVLVAIQMATSIAAYIPAVRVADRVGRKPFVIATFVFFALFPVAVVLSNGFGSLVVAFIIGGLREIGEPSRKAMIVDLALPAYRGRTVGLYYLIRSVSIAPAAYIGGLLWTLGARTPFLAAGIVGLAGTIVFAMTVEERYAS